MGFLPRLVRLALIFDVLLWALAGDSVYLLRNRHQEMRSSWHVDLEAPNWYGQYALNGAIHQTGELLLNGPTN